MLKPSLASTALDLAWSVGCHKTMRYIWVGGFGQMRNHPEQGGSPYIQMIEIGVVIGDLVLFRGCSSKIL